MTPVGCPAKSKGGFIHHSPSPCAFRVTLRPHAGTSRRFSHLRSGRWRSERPCGEDSGWRWRWPRSSPRARAGRGGEEAEEREGGEREEAGEHLSAFELEHGIGPVKERLVIGPVDPALAATGQAIYDQKCAACHKLDVKYVGPPLGEVTTRRTPEFVMNMILNPQEMVERHPVAKQLLAEHMTFMANQNLTVEDARAVLEYLRTKASSAAKP